MAATNSTTAERIARFAVGEADLTSQRATELMARLGLCQEVRTFVHMIRSVSQQGDLTMEGVTLEVLIETINDVIEKSRRERLREQITDFFSKYTFVLETWTEDDKPHKECREKRREVGDHLRNAMNAARSGNADGVQEAIARALDDLEELAKCLGIQVRPF